MRPVGIIQGIPRKKFGNNKSPGKELKKGVESYTRIIKMYAPVGIIGYDQSGKKTLAYRFERMEDGPFNYEVPEKPVYITTIEGNFYPLELNRRFVLILRFYIIPPWRFPPFRPQPPMETWNDFCCMLGVFDVTDSDTFQAVQVYLRHLMYIQFNFQRNFFLVGNKSDLRRAYTTRNTTEVRMDTAETVAASFEIPYFECSAKQHENVWSLLLAIKNCGAKPRYIIL